MFSFRCATKSVTGTKNVRAVIERYKLTPDHVRVFSEVDGTVSALRVCFPALVFDGADATHISITNSTATVSLGNDRQVLTVESPAGAKLELSGNLVRSRNGYLQGIEAEVRGKRVTYSLRPGHQVTRK